MGDRILKRIGAVPVEELKSKAIYNFVNLMSYLQGVKHYAELVLSSDYVGIVSQCCSELARLFSEYAGVPYREGVLGYNYYSELRCNLTCKREQCATCNFTVMAMHNDKVVAVDSRYEQDKAFVYTIDTSASYNDLDWLSEKGERILHKLILYRRMLPAIYEELSLIKVNTESCEEWRECAIGIDSLKGSERKSAIEKLMDTLEKTAQLKERNRELHEAKKIMLDNLSGSYGVLTNLCICIALAEPTKAAEYAPEGVEVSSYALSEACADGCIPAEDVISMLYQAWALCALRSLT